VEKTDKVDKYNKY